jgi:mRNA-degrading endonuclease YafQ of YafQ-DinJ toxin-antitoxin module
MRKTEVLGILGFMRNLDNGMCVHPLTGDFEFDFYSCSVNSIVQVIYNAGYSKGREDLKAEFKKLID